MATTPIAWLDAFTVLDDGKHVAVKLADLNVLDQNDDEDAFGTHKITVSDSRFEIRKEVDTDGDDTDGSTWELWLKKDAVFNYETDGDKKGTFTVTLTATDGGGLSTKGVFNISIKDVVEPDASAHAHETGC